MADLGLHSQSLSEGQPLLLKPGPCPATRGSPVSPHMSPGGTFTSLSSTHQPLKMKNIEVEPVSLNVSSAKSLKVGLVQLSHFTEEKTKVLPEKKRFGLRQKSQESQMSRPLSSCLILPFVSQPLPERQLPAHLLSPNKISSGPSHRCSIQAPLVLAFFQSLPGEVSPGSTHSWSVGKVLDKNAQTLFTIS